MITLVTSFKKFKGVYDTIQRSAIYSWKTLPVYAPVSEIDTVQKCSSYPNIKILQDFHIRRGVDIGFNLHVPVFKDLMNAVLPLATTTMVGMISSDLILPDDFSQRCAEIFDNYGYDIILAGTRHNIKLVQGVTDEESYKKVFEEKRFLHDVNSSDIFITSRFIWRKILKAVPEFLFGRPYLNEYLYLNVEIFNAKRYNCTNSIITLHPIHSPDYVRLLETDPSPTAEHNQRLLAGVPFIYSKIKQWPAV